MTEKWFVKNNFFLVFLAIIRLALKEKGSQKNIIVSKYVSITYIFMNKMKSCNLKTLIFITSNRLRLCGFANANDTYRRFCYNEIFRKFNMLKCK